MTTLDLNLERIKQTYSYKQDPEAFLDAAAGVMTAKARNLYKLPNLRAPDVAIIKNRNNELGIDPRTVNAAYAQGSNTAGQPQIYVTEGLTEQLTQDQALAALGHEIGHQVQEEQRVQNGEITTPQDEIAQEQPDIFSEDDNEIVQRFDTQSQVIILRSYSDESAEIANENDIMQLLQAFMAMAMSDPNEDPFQIMMGDGMDLAQDNSTVQQGRTIQDAQQEEMDSDEKAGELTGSPELVKETLAAVDPEGLPDPTGEHPTTQQRIDNIDAHFGIKKFG